MKTCKTPCNECAFRRDSKPGIDALGGAPAEVYVGQIHGPFRIPCHRHYPKNDSDQEWRNNDSTMFEIPQCAGSAVFRANLGRNNTVPKDMRLDPDRATVFSSYAEFYAHHKSISLFEAERQLSVRPPATLLLEEMHRAGVKKRISDNPHDSPVYQEF